MPKYLNSPQTVLFDKGRLLYGLDKARKPIRVQDQAVIVEGYLDVIALHQYGFTNVVSPMGTALNEHQLRVLKTLSRRIVLALDADAAGDRATLRGLEIARQTLDREDEILFDARGLLQHEARLQADIRVAVLPKGMDPDEVVHRNPDEWKKILENARPIVIHVMDTLAANRDLNDPKQKDEVARQVLPLIEDVPSSIERETYRQRLARLLHVDERAFVNIRAYSHRSASARRASTGKPSSDKQQTGINFISVPNYEREAHILGILLRDPSLLFRIDRALQEEKLDRFAEQDFLRSDYQQIFTILHFSLEQDEIEPYKYIQNKLSSLLLEVADDLYARTEKVVLEDERIVDDIFRTLLYLRRNNFQRQKDVLDNQLSEAQEQGSEEVLEELKVQLHETLKIIYRCDLARQRLVHFG
jgi:DNA primase